MKTRTILSLIAIVIALLAGPITLHFTQNAHNRLRFDIAKEFPPGQAFPSGAAFASTMMALVEHELSGLAGWRPNDFVLWSPRLLADNNANRQLGIIQAIRESARVLKDNLTKVSATTYDPNLVAADTAFRNDATKLWLPSAESKLKEGAAALRAYVVGLNATPQVSKPMNRRNVELIRLLGSWTDLLGAAHANLFKQVEEDGGRVTAWTADDYYYHAQGFAHVLYHLSLAVQREYAAELAERPIVASLFAEVSDALRRAAVLSPLIVLDSAPNSLFANHRRNLDGYIVEARQKMYSIREELEK